MRAGCESCGSRSCKESTTSLLTFLKGNSSEEQVWKSRRRIRKHNLIVRLPGPRRLAFPEVAAQPRLPRRYVYVPRLNRGNDGMDMFPRALVVREHLRTSLKRTLTRTHYPRTTILCSRHRLLFVPTEPQ